MKMKNAEIGMTVSVFGRQGTIVSMSGTGAVVAFPNGYEAGYYWEYVHKTRGNKNENK